MGRELVTFSAMVIKQDHPPKQLGPQTTWLGDCKWLMRHRLQSQGSKEVRQPSKHSSSNFARGKKGRTEERQVVCCMVIGQAKTVGQDRPKQSVWTECSAEQTGLSKRNRLVD